MRPRYKKWLGLSEQLSPKDKWNHGGVNALGKAHESKSVVLVWKFLYCTRGYRRGAARQHMLYRAFTHAAFLNAGSAFQ